MNFLELSTFSSVKFFQKHDRRYNSNFSTFAAGKKSRWRGAVVSKVNLISHEFSKQYSYVNLIFNFQLLVKSVEKNKAVWAINARQISQKMIHWYYFWSEMSKKSRFWIVILCLKDFDICLPRRNQLETRLKGQYIGIEERNQNKT